jgi:hypothetical protein
MEGSGLRKSRKNTGTWRRYNPHPQDLKGKEMRLGYHKIVKASAQVQRLNKVDELHAIV